MSQPMPTRTIFLPFKRECLHHLISVGDQQQPELDPPLLRQPKGKMCSSQRRDHEPMPPTSPPLRKTQGSCCILRASLRESLCNASDNPRIKTRGLVPKGHRHPAPATEIWPGLLMLNQPLGPLLCHFS